MKLVDILARELKVWPEGVKFITQEGGGYLFDEANYPLDILVSTADDNLTGVVERAQWQAAVDALKADEIAYSAENVNVNVNYATHASLPANAECKIVQPEWNGEGLPPVGVVLDWREKTGSQWVEATVLFITDSSVVLQREDGFEWQMLTKATVFRQLRTSEQIAAAEAREVEINRMVATASIIDKSWARKVCADLYDAGYRKFEILDN